MIRLKNLELKNLELKNNLILTYNFKLKIQKPKIKNTMKTKNKYWNKICLVFELHLRFSFWILSVLKL